MCFNGCMVASSPETNNIYLERSGKGSKEASERLLEAPADPLDESEKADVRLYEEELCRQPVYGDMSLEHILTKHIGETLAAPTFFSEAFIKGQIHVEGLEGSLRQLRTPGDVYTWLAQAARDQSIPVKDMLEMARQSAAHYKTEAAQALLRGDRPHEATLDRMPIVVDPYKTLEFAEGVIEARRYLLDKRREFGREARGLNGAKRAMTDIYLKRVNGQIAGDIPVLEFLVEQSRLIDDEEMVAGAYLAMPASLREAANNPERRVLLNKRLDYIRNGIGYDSDGRATAVDSEVVKTASGETVVEADAPIFNAEQREALRREEVSPEEMIQLFTEVVRSAGLLSDEDPSTWSPGRGHRAADQLFQVVMHPTKDTFAVNGIDGVVTKPNKPRSLYDVMTIGVHELTHINQTQLDRQLGEVLHIGKLKGRRVSMLRETGANLVQRQLERELFGESKPVALAYARAIQRLETGGDMFDATQAFYEEKRRVSSGAGEAKIAAEAADRTLRLMLSGGANSQPMSYAEENIMNAELQDADPQVKSRATLLTSLDLDDQQRLHRYGLLPDVHAGGVDWAPYLLSALQPFIERALNR